MEEKKIWNFLVAHQQKRDKKHAKAFLGVFCIHNVFNSHLCFSQVFVSNHW